jgi:tRNA threonylcarbamoyladenosine biosynthesis protein TsaE
VSTRRVATHSEHETRAAACEVAGGLPTGTTLLLFGDLGAGKTAFVKGLAEGLGIPPDDVTSPTFTLVHEYRGGRLPLLHVDLYRLDSADLDDIGLDEDLAARGIVAIECGGALAAAAPRRDPNRHQRPRGNARTIEITLAEAP